MTQCAVGPKEFRAFSEGEIASNAPLPVRAVYEGLVRSTLVGLVHRPISSTSAGIAAVRNRGRLVLPEQIIDSISQVDHAETSPGTRGFETLLDELCSEKPHLGSLDYLIDGKEFFDALNLSIDRARESLSWYIYIFDNDDYAVAIADRLRKRSHEVSVRILSDRLGTVMAGYSKPLTPYPEGFKPPASIAEYLSDGSKVRFRKQSNAWLVSDHTKLLLFDGKEAYVGGMNIGREYRSEWHDLMVKLRGPIVDRLAEIFEDRWDRTAYFGDLTHRFQGKRPAKRAEQQVEGAFPIRIIHTAPWKYEIEKTQLAAIRSSKRQITVFTPYFSSDAIKLELGRAAQRGVDVRVVIPGKNDSGIMELANWETAAQLVDSGVKIYRYKGLMHLKAAIYDDWVCLGSANMDTLSLRINRELNLGFSHPAAVDAFRKRVLIPDFARSTRLSAEQVKAKRNPWIEPFGDQL